MIVNSKRRLVYVYPDGRESIEEYDIKTHELLSRKVKNPSHFKEAKWVYEIGEFEDKQASEMLVKSNNAVSLSSLSLFSFAKIL